METLYRKTEKPVLVLELIFKLLFITYGFLQASSITFGNKIISVVLWPTIALGGLLILYRFLFFKKYKDSTGIYILIFFFLFILFCVSGWNSCALPIFNLHTILIY